MSTVTVEWCPWPAPDAEGCYVARCSCGLQVIGTASELDTWGRRHDDSPGREHVARIRGRVIREAA